MSTTHPPELIEICRYLRGDIGISDFEAWVYACSSLELFVGTELYFQLIDTNYRKRDTERSLRENLSAWVEAHHPIARAFLERERALLDEQEEGRRQPVVEIDLLLISTPRALHAALAKALGFGSHYGHNWDAFWDCITADVAMPQRLQLRNWSAFEARLPRDAASLRACLASMTQQYPASAAVVEYT